MLGDRSIKINGADCGMEALLLGAVTALGGFLFGYDTGQISAMVLFRDYMNRFAQTRDDGTKYWQPIILSLLVSLLSIGCMIGALSGAYTADWWGRRKSLAAGVVYYLIGCTIQMTSMNTWVQITMGRFTAGLGIGTLSVGVPMFQSEASPREIRGAVIVSYQFMITLGILIANIINLGFRNIQDSSASWRSVIGIGMAVSVPLGLGVFAIPESPRWLASQGDWDGARLALARLRGVKSDLNNRFIERDLNEMRENMEREKQVGNSTWIECFYRGTEPPKIRYRTFLGMAILFLQQWTGVNYFFYYGVTIFQSVGIEDSIVTQLILGAVNVATTSLGIYMVDKYGRRWPLFIGALWQSIWLLIFASVGTAVPPEGNRGSGITMIVSACMFIASFASTWGPMAWVVVGETFPLRTRAKQASLATATNWLGNFLIGFLTPLATAGISFAYGFVFFGTNLAAAIIVWFFFYEPRALSLENIDIMYGEPGLKPWRSTKWVPPGYITRTQRIEDDGEPKMADASDLEKSRPDSNAATTESKEHQL